MTTQQVPKSLAHPDPEFADGGRATIQTPDSWGKGAGVATDEISNVFFSLHYEGGYGVGKLTDEGKADPTFGNDGLVLDKFAEEGKSSGGSVSILPKTGRILLSGVHSGKNMLLTAFALFEPDGIYVSEFGENGKVIVPFPSELTSANPDANPAPAVGIGAQNTPVITIDGKILFIHNNTIFRLNADGSVDTSFNKGLGYIRVTHPEYQVWTNCLLQPEPNLILVGGTCLKGDTSFGVLVQFHETGDLDTSYGKNGLVVLDNENSAIHQLVAKDDKRIVAVGASRSGPNKGLLVRFDEKGQPDLGFNNGEPLLTPESDKDEFSWNSATFDSKGRILTTGFQLTTGNRNDIPVGRTTAQGYPDTEFNSLTGWIRTMGFEAVAIAVDKEDRPLVVCTTSFMEGEQKAVIIRIVA
jgi:uncharacterized delta-60 repeat protein